MGTLLIAVGAFVGYIIAYHTYGRWLARKIFRLDPNATVPSVELNDNADYVPTRKAIVFGHHFTSIAGTGPIVGPAIAVMWGWLPALLWVFFGSILIGAVHDFGSLVVSLRSRGQTVGDIAGRVLNRRVRLMFLLVLFMALTIVLAIFGLVIASVFRLYPAAIFPCIVQIPIAVAIGVWLHRKGVGLMLPSAIALVVMYVTVIFGDQNTQSGVALFDEHIGVWLHSFNTMLASWPTIVWVVVLLVYSYIASVLPVWLLLQPRDYINSLQLLTALGLVVMGLCIAAFLGGAAPPPPVETLDSMQPTAAEVSQIGRPPLEIAAPMVNFSPTNAPWLIPFLFITIACGAISGFHCLVSSGTTSKQIRCETDAQLVGYGSMLTEGFLAVLVILACVAGLGLGAQVTVGGTGGAQVLYGEAAFAARYSDWNAAGALGAKVAAFVDGAANFLAAMHIPKGVGLALMGVLVASFAGTTLDTACRLQRYVIQELASTVSPVVSRSACPACGYDLSFNVTGACPECGVELGAAFDEAAQGGIGRAAAVNQASARAPSKFTLNPLVWLTNKHGATILAITLATAIAALPAPGAVWTMQSAGTGGLILWPLFGATNQLLGGLAFMVIAFWLWRRKLPVWFVVPPMLFMLLMPAAAMMIELPRWWRSDDPNWVVIFVAAATLLLEIWMLVEAWLLWPRAKGVLEEALPQAALAGTDAGRSC